MLQRVCVGCDGGRNRGGRVSSNGGGRSCGSDGGGAKSLNGGVRKF